MKNLNLILLLMGAEEMPPLTDSEISDIEEEEMDRPVPPLTDGEDSETEGEEKDPNKRKGKNANEKNRNLEPSGKANKANKFLKKRRSKITPEPMSERVTTLLGQRVIRSQRKIIVTKTMYF